MTVPRGRRLRYGVDGWPYVVGLGGGGIAMGAVCVATALRGRSRAVTWVTGLIATSLLVPAGLGADYVLAGKLGLRDRVLDAVTWSGDEVVLDIGSGAGLLAVGAAHRVPYGHVVAVDLWVAKDLSGNGADRLRHNAQVDGVADRVEICTGDARSLDLSDDSVDVVLSTLCLHNIAERAGRRAAVSELARVLRPGGTVVVTDLGGTSDIARWLEQEGLLVSRHARMARTFLPQRMVVARAPR